MSGDLKSMKVSPKVAKNVIIKLQSYYRDFDNQNMFDDLDELRKNIILIYLYLINKLDYQSVVKNYKKEYLENEAALEPDVSPEEMIGLGRIYDYIRVFNFNNQRLDVLLDGMKIHMLLYSACPFPEYGGKLRSEPVVLNDVAYEVPAARDAVATFQSYVGKKIEMDDGDIFGYINRCIRISTDLIKAQPFSDGNKRTFRGLLNLMLAKVGIPPIYIVEEERKQYKDALLKAIIDNDYEDLISFYYLKICDSIVDLDLTKTKENENGKPFIVEVEKKEVKVK